MRMHVMYKFIAAEPAWACHHTDDARTCTGHCKRMVPEFTKLGEKIAGDGKLSSRVVVAKVGGVPACIGCIPAQLRVAPRPAAACRHCTTSRCRRS